MGVSGFSWLSLLFLKSISMQIHLAMLSVVLTFRLPGDLFLTSKPGKQRVSVCVFAFEK